MISIILLWLLIIILLFIFLKLLNINKNFFISFLISILIIIFIINIELSISSALTGLNLVVKTILPTIFPFAVICNLLIYYDGISLYSKILGPLLCKPLRISKVSSFPIVASMISGYPLGCRYCCDLYELGYINKKEFQRLLNIASNASPMFIIGSIGVGMLGNPQFGFILLLANYISPIIVGFLTLPSSQNLQNNNIYNTKSTNINIGVALKNSIENALNTTFQVSAFVVIFSILMGIIKNSTYLSTAFSSIENLFNLPKSSLYGLFLGSIEFTNGCKLISECTSLSLPFKLSIISFICSFSGLSVIAQITSFIGKHSISIKKYVFYKIIQGIISFIITFVISFLFIDSFPASSISNLNSGIIINNIYLSCILFLLISLLISILLNFYKKLHIS